MLNKKKEEYEQYEQKELKDELIKNFIEFVRFLNEVETKIKNEFKYDYHLKIKIEFKNDDNNISATYVFYIPNSENEIKTFKEDNILKCKTNSKVFQNLIENINDKKFKNIKKEQSVNNVNKDSQINTSSVNNVNKDSQINTGSKPDENRSNIEEPTKSVISFVSFLRNKNQKKKIFLADEIKVIEFADIIGTHKEKKNICAALFIKELSNGAFISSGTEMDLFYM